MKDGHFGGFYGRKVNLRPNRFEIQRKLRKLLSKTQKAMRLAYCIHALNLSIRHRFLDLIVDLFCIVLSGTYILCGLNHSRLFVFSFSITPLPHNTRNDFGNINMPKRADDALWQDNLTMRFLFM